jgi:ribokinase
VAAARQGASVHFVGAVGGDDFGARQRQSLAQEGIDLTHLATVDSMATGVAMIAIDARGQNMIVLSEGANGSVSVHHVEAAKSIIESADVLLCQLETPLPAVVRAIEIAHAHGVPAMLNPAPARPLEQELLAKLAYLLPNETEAALLTGMPVAQVDEARRAAQHLRVAGALRVLITLGAQGVLIADERGSSLEPAMTVPVVDTTGAGDTFVGCFAVAIAEGRALTEAVREAQCAAALKVTRLGAQTAIPRRAEVQAFLQRLRPGPAASQR